MREFIFALLGLCLSALPKLPEIPNGFYIRQKMLANSFSYLPVRLSDISWALISDYHLALALRNTDQKRYQVLGLTLENAIKKELITPYPTQPIPPDLDLGTSLARMDLYPLLVHHSEYSSEVIGIVTSFDLM